MQTEYCGVTALGSPIGNRDVVLSAAAVAAPLLTNAKANNTMLNVTAMMSASHVHIDCFSMTRCLKRSH